MCGSPSVPTPHDPGQTAKTQQEYNTQAGNATQQANAMSQYTPFGSLVYTPTTDPKTGITTYAATQTLDPKNQQLLENIYGSKNLAGQGATNVLQGAYTGAPNIVGTANSLTNQMMSGEMGYLTPFFSQQTNALDNQLRNQGLMPGTPAYDNAMNTLRQNQGQTVSGAIAQFQPAAFQEAVTAYGLPASIASQLQALGGPMGLGLISTPQTQYQAANYTGAVASADQAAMEAYKAQMEAQAAEIAGIAGAAGKIGGAAIMASDRKLKTGIIRIGALFDGTPLYAFRYKTGGPLQFGVMAQDVEGANPEAVFELDGVKLVDYAKVAAKAALAA